MSDSESLDRDHVLKREIIEIVERRIVAGNHDDPFGHGSSANLVATNLIHKESMRNLR